MKQTLSAGTVTNRSSKRSDAPTLYKCGGCTCKVKLTFIIHDIICSDIPWEVDLWRSAMQRFTKTILIFPGTKADLWNTVSPKMAQRVFSEMLNESLSIITTRFIHVRSRDILLVSINFPIYFLFFYFYRTSLFIFIVSPQCKFYIRPNVNSVFLRFCSFVRFIYLHTFAYICLRFIEARLDVVCVSNWKEIKDKNEIVTTTGTTDFGTVRTILVRRL